MTQPDQVEFHEQVRSGTGRPTAVRVGIVAGAAVLFVVGAIAAMGASPSPNTGADPAASSDPGSTPAPAASVAPKSTTDKPDRLAWGGFGMHGDMGPGGFRDITITAIDGSSLSLKTDDGWTRTISITSSTTITKGGATIPAGDLAVGDQIRFAQERQTDGSYTITRIVVVLPTVGGEVTKIDGNTLTVTQRDGTTATIHVDGDTTYRVNGADGKLSDIKVGSFVVAEGTKRSDGSLDAAAVRSGGRDGHGPGSMDGHHGQADPNATPAPTSGAS